MFCSWYRENDKKWLSASQQSQNTNIWIVDRIYFRSDSARSNRSIRTIPRSYCVCCTLIQGWFSLSWLYIENIATASVLPHNNTLFFRRSDFSPFFSAKISLNITLSLAVKRYKNECIERAVEANKHLSESYRQLSFNCESFEVIKPYRRYYHIRRHTENQCYRYQCCCE